MATTTTPTTDDPTLLSVTNPSTTNDIKPWTTTDVPTLSATLDNYYDWSSIVQAMVEFHDATHLLTTTPAPEEHRLAKQLTFFLSRTVASTHRPALLGQSPSDAWATLQALNPQTGHLLEDLVQQCYKIHLTDLGPTAFASQHRLVQSQIVQRQATHHYATPQAYLNRVLKGIEGHADVRHVRITFRNIQHPTLADIENLYREIADSCTEMPLPRAHAASSKHRFNRGPSKYTRPTMDPTITDYNCSVCRVDNHNTKDCRRKTRSRSYQGSSRYRDSVEIANAFTLDLASMFQNTTLPPSGAPVNEQKSPFPRLPRYLLDSAASITMHPTRHPFQTYHASQNPVQLADQRTTPAIGEGRSIIPTIGHSLTLHRALHVPHLHDHVVSAAQVASTHDILFQGPKVYILQPGPMPPASAVVAQGRRSEGVYELHTDVHKASAVTRYAIRAQAI
jgi:hypothetical protein